jgi:conjugative relaxase-like TrwC/TraI family protein
MLSIGKLGKGQERYYLGKVAEGAEDYYSGEGEEAGEWIGDAAARLGLDGEVGEDQLVAMLTGRNPVDGAPLLGTSGVPASGSVPGFDLTFSAPKSVSLLWGLGGAEAAADVQAAHREAGQAALGYMQREAARRGRLAIRQRQWLSRSRLSPPLLAQPRSPAPHPRSRRQRDQGRRPLDAPLPPGDL